MADPIVDRIIAGEFDGHLDDIVLAILERARSGAVAFKWRLRLDGDEWTQDSATLGEMKFAEQHAWVHKVDAAGRTVSHRATYPEIDPRGNAEHLVALIVAHLHRAQGLPLADALKRAEAIPLSQMDDLVSEYEVVAAPKDDSAVSTSS